MKRRKNYIGFTKIAALTVLLFNAGCQDLKEHPLSDITPSNFFKTAGDLDAALMATYRALAGGQGIGFAEPSVFAPFSGSDDLTTHPASNKQPWREFDTFTGSAANPRNERIYNGLYRAVAEANNVLANYERVVAPEAVKQQAAGQAHFIRGFSYFFLTQLYGRLPLQTTPEVQFDLKRSPVQEVYNLIVSDLQKAEEFLPDKWNNQPGRANKGAAKAVLAKVYLTMGGWPLKQQDKYALAAAKAKEVIDNAGTYGFTLLNNFSDLWKVRNKNNAEGVFVLQYCLPCGVQYANLLAGKAGQPEDEGGWSDYYSEINFFNNFPEGPRKDATFHTVFKVKQSNGTYKMVPWQESKLKHPYYAKWRDGGIDEAAPEKSTPRTDRNIALMRYAEVLLIFAEAQARASGPDAAAYEAVNKVRRRAGLSDLPQGLSTADFVKAVLNERAWEFAAEHTRWFDLVRTEMVEEVAAQRHPNENPITVTVTKNHYLAPIPATEILINRNLDQNP